MKEECMNCGNKTQLGYCKNTSCIKTNYLKIVGESIYFESYVKFLQQQNDSYKSKLDEIREYINFLVIFDPNIGKFSETIWGEEILEIIDKE